MIIFLSKFLKKEYIPLLINYITILEEITCDPINKGILHKKDNTQNVPVNDNSAGECIINANITEEIINIDNKNINQNTTSDTTLLNNENSSLSIIPEYSPTSPIEIEDKPSINSSIVFQNKIEKIDLEKKKVVCNNNSNIYKFSLDMSKCKNNTNISIDDKK